MIKTRGLSLIELLVFIVIVGVAVTGLLSVYQMNVRASADPVIRKQAVAIAESLLEEVLAQPYTYCDPDDANADAATSSAGCATLPEGTGPENAGTAETRYDNLTPFDNVNDYDRFTMTGIRDVENNAVTGLEAYTASVSVQPTGAFNGVPAGETLLVTVTVTSPDNQRVSLSGYRTRYAPNT